MAELPPGSSGPASRRDLTLAAAESAPTRAWITLTQGTFLRGFLLQHGATNTVLAWLDNLPLIALIFQPLVSLGLAHSPRLAEWTLRSLVLERLTFLIPILVILFLDLPTIPAWALILLAVSYIAGAIALSGWYTWLAGLTEGVARGAFIARRSRFDSWAAILLGLSAAAFLDWTIRREVSALGYLACFLAAGTLGAGTPWCLGRIKARPTGDPRHRRVDWNELQRPLRNVRFTRYLAFTGWLTFGQAVSSPFWMVYMIRQLEMSFLAITLYGVLATLSALACYGWWGRLADRVGVTPLLRVLCYIRVLNPLLWLLLTKETIWWILIPEAILTGMFVAGLAPLMLVYALKEASGEERGMYLSYYHAAQGVAALIGAAAGAALTSWRPDLAIPWGAGYVLTIYHLPFLVTALVRLTAAEILHPIKEPDALRVRELWPHVHTALRILPTRPKAH